VVVVVVGGWVVVVVVGGWVVVVVVGGFVVVVVVGGCVVARIFTGEIDCTTRGGVTCCVLYTGGLLELLYRNLFKNVGISSLYK